MARASLMENIGSGRYFVSISRALALLLRCGAAVVCSTAGSASARDSLDTMGMNLTMGAGYLMTGEAAGGR